VEQANRRIRQGWRCCWSARFRDRLILRIALKSMATTGMMMRMGWNGN